MPWRDAVHAWFAYRGFVRRTSEAPGRQQLVRLDIPLPGRCRGRYRGVRCESTEYRRSLRSGRYVCVTCGRRWPCESASDFGTGATRYVPARWHDLAQRCDLGRIFGRLQPETRRAFVAYVETAEGRGAARRVAVARALGVSQYRWRQQYEAACREVEGALARMEAEDDGGLRDVG